MIDATLPGAPGDLEESAGTTASDFDRIEKRSLADNRGQSLRDFRAGLKPRFTTVWRDLLSGYAALALTLAGLVWAQNRLSAAVAAAAAIAGALLIGYALTYIHLFIHEAAHYNIAPRRRANDILANLFVGVIAGQNIAQYRAIHFDHHRYLGTTRDTERNYFDPLTLRFFVEALTGIRVLKVIAVRQRAASTSASARAETSKKSMVNIYAFCGLLLHGAILVAAVWERQWAVGAAWLAGTVLIFPFFVVIRQVLEHRSENARPDINYAEVDHGAVNRMFGSGPLASTLGGAGFNRHLLHHWEPQISYTRLRELEHYLLDTAAADALRRHRTTYWATFHALLCANERREPR